MAVYDTSLIEGTSGPVAYATGVNTLSHGILGIGLLGFCIVVGFGLGIWAGWDKEKSLILGFANASLFSVLIWSLGWIAWGIAIIPLLLFVLSVLIRVLGGD